MVRVVKISGKYYGVEITDFLQKEMEEIIGFASQSIPVLIVQDITELEDLDIYEEVVMVERDGTLFS